LVLETDHCFLAAGTGVGDGYRVKGTAAGPSSAHDEYVSTLDPGKQAGTTPYYLNSIFFGYENAAGGPGNEIARFKCNDLRSSSFALALQEFA
jgi:hypothetical protein